MNCPTLDTGGRRSLLAAVTLTVVIKTLVTASLLLSCPDTIPDKIDKDVLSLVPDLTVVTMDRWLTDRPAGNPSWSSFDSDSTVTGGKCNITLSLSKQCLD